MKYDLGNKMKIVILGNGYIGKNLNKHLSKKYQVSVITQHDMNYHDVAVFSQYIKLSKPHIVIGCFGFTGKPNIDEAESKKEECWKLNVQIPLMINTVCANNNIFYTHISTGCLFNGYEKNWSENDIPNFGLFHNSSFYTKSKHAFELASSHLPNTLLRIRLPFSADLKEDRNLFKKLLKYDNLINFCNSKTSIDDLCYSINLMINDETILTNKKQIFHMVNPQPLTTIEIITEMKKYGLENKNWNIIDLKELQSLTPKSNCVLSTIDRNNPMMCAPTELESLQTILKTIDI